MAVVHRALQALQSRGNARFVATAVGAAPRAAHGGAEAAERRVTMEAATAARGSAAPDKVVVQRVLLAVEAAMQTAGAVRTAPWRGNRGRQPRALVVEGAQARADAVKQGAAARLALEAN